MLEHTQSLAFLGFLILIVAYGMYQTFIRGKTPLIRRFAALEAMDEGINRAIEMGKAVHFGVVGLGSGVNAQTLSTLTIMGHFARMAARTGVPAFYTTQNNQVLMLMRGVVDDAYSAEGKSELVGDPNMVQMRFMGGRGPTYPTAYAGLLQRENIGSSVVSIYGKNVLTIGEANREANTFAIQLAPAYDKLEWGIPTFDYTLILAENYVARAMISQDKAQLGSAIGMDIIAWLMILLLVGSTVVATVLGTSLYNILVG